MALALTGLAITAAFVPQKARAVNGVWTGATNNAWATGTNWTGGIPNAAGEIADFSQKDLAAAQTVNLAGANKTVGTLKVGDANTTTPFNYTFNGTGGQLILLGAGNTAGTIEVVNQTATINTAILIANQGLIKNGTGTLALANATSTIANGIALNAGTLSFVAGALGSNTITVGGTSALTWNTTGDVTDLSSKIILGSGFTLTLNLSGGAADNTTFASTIGTSGGTAGRIVKANGGILTITAAQNYTGGTQVNNGRVILSGGDDRLSSAGALTFGSNANGGIVQLGDAAAASNQTVSSLGVSGSGVNAFVGGFTANSTLTVNNATNITNTPLLGGAGVNENNLALAKTGTGSLTLSKANSFTGDVAISGGTVIAASTAPLGGGTKTVTISGTTHAPSLQLNLASGISLPATFNYLTSNDDAVTPAILNAAGANVIGGSIALGDAGFGATQTRIKVEAGSLQLTGNIAPAASAASGRTLILDGAANGTASGALADTGGIKLGLTKEGAGTWTLTAPGSYSGPTNIAAGRLNTNTAQTGNGAITVGSAATLGLALAGSGQSLAPSALSIADSTLAFQLGSFANPLANSPLINTGTFAIAGTNFVTVAGTGLNVGTFPLVKYSGALGGVGFAGLPSGNLPSSAVPARVTANLVNDSANSQVLLNISAFDVPKWTAAVNSDWDINDGADPTMGTGTVNWKESGSGATTRYLQIGSTVDSVLFDDTAISNTVNLTATAPLAPASATVNTAATYTFSGLGKLSGSATLNKQGVGVLILANAGSNDYSGTTTISAGTLQVGDGATANAGQLGTGPVVNHGALTLNRLEDIAVANAISGGGTLVKQAANIVTLSGNNALFTGAITVAAGTLKVGNNNALGDSSAGTTVQSGATLDVAGFTVADAVQLAGTLSSTSGTSNVNGPVTLSIGSAVDVAAGTLTLGNAVTGSVALVKNNAGTLALTGSASFSGGATVNAGTLRLAGTSSFTGGLTLNAGTVIAATDQGYTGGSTVLSGTLQIGAAAAATTGNVGPGEIALNPASPNISTLSVLRGDDALNITNNITSSGTGTNAVTIGATGASSASGTVTFSGTNTFTGNVTINGGALRITNSSALGLGPKTVNVQANSRPALLLDGSMGDLALAAGISFNVSSDGAAGSAANNPGGIVNLAGNNTINGNIAVTNGGGGNGKIVSAGGLLTLAGTIDAAGATGARTLVLGGAAAGAITGVVADWFDTVNSATRTVSVTKDGAGSWTLAGLNTFSGAVAVQAGTLKFNAVDLLGNAQPLGTGSNAVALGTATTVGTLEYTGGTAALAQPISVTANGPGGIVRNNGGGVLMLGANVARNNNTSFTLAGGAFDVTGVISGGNAAASVVVSGAQVRLSAANSYAGTTRVQDGGILKNGFANALPAGTTLTLGEATSNTGGVYDLNGFDQTISKLSGAGSGAKLVTNGAISGTSTLTVSGASTFDGTIQDGATALTALTKSGTGALVVSGTNTYTGPTIVSGGTLELSGSISAQSPVSLTGGTLLLGAWDRIHNAANLVLGGGTFSTGGFGEGDVTTAGLGALTLSAASVLDFGAGTSLLHFASLGGIGDGATLAITNWTGTSYVAGGADRLIFSGDENARLAFEIAVPQSAISFDGTGGYAAVQFDPNHFEIVAIPEPSSSALFAASLLVGLAGYRERRRFSHHR